MTLFTLAEKKKYWCNDGEYLIYVTALPYKLYVDRQYTNIVYIITTS